MASSSPAKRLALGKGLEALLPSKPSGSVASLEAGAAPDQGAGTPLQIPIALIDTNPFQTRRNFDGHELNDLLNSIRAIGVIQPITVRRLDGGRYGLIAGERRLRASKTAMRDVIPAFVVEANDQQTLEMTIVENLQRADLNPMEQARAFERLGQEFKMTQEQVAARTGKDRATVGNFMRLLRLPEPIQQQVEWGTISFGHAKALMALESQEQVMNAAKKVVSLQLSVRATENMVKNLLDPEGKIGKPAEQPEEIDPNVREAQEKIQRSIGLRTRVVDRKGKGKVVIEYSSLEDFDTLLEMLTK